jgi:hypothetical protein
MGASSGDSKHQNVIKKSAITGLAVVLEMLSGGLFMENVKMEKQRTSMPYPEIMRKVLSQGIKGFEAGFWPWGFIMGITKGTVLGGSRAFLFKFSEESLGLSRRSADIVSGFGSGAVQGVFMSPILLARVRVNQSLLERAAQGTINTGLFAEMKLSTLVLNKAIKEEGFGVLTKGMQAMVLKRALDWGTRFMFIGAFEEYFKSLKNGEKLTDSEKLAASFIGGAASVSVTMPIDRMIPILQQSGASGEGFFQILKKKMASEGLTTLQRGLVMRTIHTGYHTTFAVFIANRLYALFD